MRRGTRELANLAMDGDHASRGVASNRSRRALGDVSNRESDNNVNRKPSESQSLRRSSGLSINPEDEPVSQDLNPEEDETKQTAVAVARRQSLRSSRGTQSSHAAANPLCEPKPRATRKRSQKTSADSTLDQQELPAEDATRSSHLPESQTKRARSNSTYRGPVPLVGTRHCQDVLRTNDHRMVRSQFSSRQYVAGIGDHDLVHCDNPLHVPSYVTDIFQRLYNAENLTRPLPYMERRQPELNSVMRAILVDWLVEVHMKFRLLPETLYLCVNIIDRYLALQRVVRNQLQLVGVTALLIACKYEEMYPPEVRDCVYITDRAYTRQEVLDMEAAIVKALNFTLTVPTGYPFIQRFLHITKSTSVVRHLASYYMERMLQEHSALAFKPSMMAAAAVCLATNHPDRRDHDDDFEDGTRTSVFPPSLLEYSGFAENEIRDAAALIEQKFGEVDPQPRRRRLVAVKRKFESAGFSEVASNFSQPKVSHLDVIL